MDKILKGEKTSEKGKSKKKGAYIPKPKKSEYEVVLVKTSSLIVLKDGHTVQIPRGDKFKNVSIGDKIKI